MLITNARLITWEPAGNQILDDHAVLIENDRIVEIDTTGTLLAKYPDAEQVDARGQYVMPGNICAHTHFYGAYARGMAIPGTPPKDFPEILQKLWWPLDRSLDAESIQFSVLPCLVDAIKHGTTTLIDFAYWREGATAQQAVEARDKDFVGKSPCDWAYHIMLHSEPPPEFSGQLAEAIQAGYPTLKIFTTNIRPAGGFVL